MSVCPLVLGRYVASFRKQPFRRHYRLYQSAAISRLTSGTACEEYYIEAFEPHHEMDAIRSKPFAIPGLLQQEGSFCQPSIVTRPSDGESVSVLAPYEFRWKADELFWYNSTSMVFDGSIIYADRVKIELLGILTNYDEEKGCEFGYTEKDNCTELTILTPEEGAPNTGSSCSTFLAM